MTLARLEGFFQDSSQARNLEHGSPPDLKLRKKQNPYKSSYVHVPTFGVYHKALRLHSSSWVACSVAHLFVSFLGFWAPIVTITPNTYKPVFLSGGHRTTWALGARLLRIWELRSGLWPEGSRSLKLPQKQISYHPKGPKYPNMGYIWLLY